MDFTATKTFFSTEMQCEYVAGMSYTARSPDHVPAGMDKKRAARLREKRAKLIDLLPQWMAEGKVVVGRPAEARLEGSS